MLFQAIIITYRLLHAMSVAHIQRRQAVFLSPLIDSSRLYECKLLRTHSVSDEKQKKT